MFYSHFFMLKKLFKPFRADGTQYRISLQTINFVNTIQWRTIGFLVNVTSLLSCNKRTNKIQKEEKKQILAKTSLQTGKNLTSFQILKMLNGFWQSTENFLENLFYSSWKSYKYLPFFWDNFDKLLKRMKNHFSLLLIMFMG